MAAISMRRTPILRSSGVIDTQTDKVVKVIRVGKDPVAYLHEP